MLKKKVLSIFLVASIGISLVACTEEIKPEKESETSPASLVASLPQENSTLDKESTGEQATEEEKTSEASTTDENLDLQATDSGVDQVKIIQPEDMDMINIARYAHQRDYMEALYQINPEDELQTGSFHNTNFSEQDIETIKSALPDNYKMSKEGQIISLQGDKGALVFGQNHNFSYSRPNWQGDEYGEHGYKATINILSSSYISSRRVLTVPQNEDLPFLTRSEAKKMAEDFFANIGLGSLILKSLYAVREAETGKPFYYLEFMQCLEGIPLADEPNIPYFPGPDMSGVYNKICCAIDEEGFAYITANKANLEKTHEIISIITKADMIEIVNAQLDSVIDGVGETFKIDSLELLWGSDEARAFGEDAPQDYRLKPYFLVVLRSTGPDPLGGDHGDRFRRWVYDAQTGSRVQ
ncbi:MAG: hypothetical protein Q4E09_06200 [Eubacteriales bacterium]|nr:hypothetical protein [Eubacteriales bacterium]